jgi:hypothetical protein
MFVTVFTGVTTGPYPDEMNPVNILTPYFITIHFNIILHFASSLAERRGRAVNTPASYLGDPGFKYWPGDLLS